GAWLLLQDRVDLPHDGVGPLKRGGLGELDGDQEVALVFLRHERPRQDLPETDGEGREGGEDEERQSGLPDERVRAPDVPLLRRREDAIERGEETAKASARRVLRSRPENQRALRGRVGEGVHQREEDGESGGESE